MAADCCFFNFFFLIRFLQDNPGFWAVHCHITTHMIQGKMIVLEEAPELIQKYQRYQK